MKTPGGSWLQFEVQPRDEGGSLLIQTAFFEPRGLFGLLYWYGLYPIHKAIFSGMARAIARRAEAAGATESATAKGMNAQGIAHETQDRHRE